MVGIGLFLVALAGFGGWLWRRGTLFENRLFLRAASLSWPLGFVAILAGWIVTETGRQPWVATGVLRTADAVSPVPGGSVALSLALFLVVYTIVFGVGINYIRLLIDKGPDPKATASPRPPDGLGNRPISAATEAAEAEAANQGDDGLLNAGARS